MDRPRLTVAWFSVFPVERLEEVPSETADVPKLHPATWQRNLLAELETRDDIRLHIVDVRKHWRRTMSFERGRCSFHLIKVPAGMRAGSFFWLDTWVIRRLLSDVRPDVVHAWGTEKGAALISTRLRYPRVVTIQGLMSVMVKFQPNLYERLMAWLERISLRRASVVTGESRYSTSYLRNQFREIDVRHIDVAPAWVFHQVVRQPQINPVRFVFIARLGYRKGGDLVLRALQQLQHEFTWELVVIGDKDETLCAEVRRGTNEDFWARIRFLADVNPTEIARELSQATLMLCPTRADTGPMAAKEAVVAGVPVIGSDVGGLPDYVVENENGFLFPTGNLEKFVKAIRAAVKHEQFSKGLVRQETLARMRDYLSPRRMADSFVSLYRELAGRELRAAAAPPHRQS